MVSDNYWVKQLWEMGILGALWYTAVLALAALAALRLSGPRGPSRVPSPSPSAA